MRAYETTGLIFVLLTYGGTLALGLWTGWTMHYRYNRDGFPKMLVPEFILRWLERITAE